MPQPEKGPNLTQQSASGIEALEAHVTELRSPSVDRTVTDLDHNGYSEDIGLTSGIACRCMTVGTGQDIRRLDNLAY